MKLLWALEQASMVRGSMAWAGPEKPTLANINSNIIDACFPPPH
jgi:hypothetical protein